MSFSGNVKEELAGHVSPARHCQLAELAALLLFGGGACEGGRHLCLDTENEAVARKCFTLSVSYTHLTLPTIYSV